MGEGSIDGEDGLWGAEVQDARGILGGQDGLKLGDQLQELLAHHLGHAVRGHLHVIRNDQVSAGAGELTGDPNGLNRGCLVRGAVHVKADATPPGVVILGSEVDQPRGFNDELLQEDRHVV